MQKILITGAYSLLGLGLLKTLPPQKYTLHLGIYNHLYNIDKLSHISLDILNLQNTREVFSKIKPDIVLHAAAISDVDYCEKNKKETIAVNINGLQNIINNCIRFKSKIIFISSNAVFNGNKSSDNGYSEKDKPDPINFYGKTKLEGEQLVQKSGLPYLITRLITMYGWEPPLCRPNPVTWQLQKLKNKERLLMVTDRFINPLYNLNASQAIWSAITKNKNGIYHIAGNDKTSRYQWALEVARIFGYPESLIKPVKSELFPQLVNRPKDTCFNTYKMEKKLGIKPLSLQTGLKLMKSSMENT
jgi:dTDP-4-dehydrorhamnose reductase